VSDELRDSACILEGDDLHKRINAALAQQH